MSPNFLTNLFPVYIWSLIGISFIYASMGIAIAFIGSLTRPKNKAITLLKSINFPDLLYSGKFIMITTFIVIGSFSLIILLCNNDFPHTKHRKTVLSITKHACQFWLIIAFSLFLLNSFKENVYNLITIIIATTATIWNIMDKLASRLILSLSKLQKTKRISRTSPKYPPKRLPRHKR
ncbi:hypothetical protein AAYR32_11190 [Streptococcus agalactiae]